jgi:ATP-binding cassette subfamily B protein
VIWVLLKKEPLLAVIILVWTLVFLSCNYFFARWKLKYDIASAEQDSRTAGTLADIITNQPAVDAHGSHQFEKSRYRAQVQLQMRLSRFRWDLGESMESLQAFLIVLVEFAIFYAGIGLWEQGRFSIGMFVLVQAYIIHLAGQLWSFSRIVRDVYESFADAKEMAEIMQTPHEITERPDARVIERATGEIRFEHVSFNYHAQQVIDDVTLHIKPGERVALVGPSGAGKSTIVKLLFRFYDPTSGSILIDGNDIRELSLVSLRETLSLVPQDPALFHRSLMENIRYGKPGASDDEVITAAKLAHCDEFIATFQKGYETLVGERGIKLSGGERQRVALARTFLRDAPIVVLDEATSSLDSESERLIQNALGTLMKGHTTLVIAHRLSTIRSVDRIVVMDKGRIIESGTHDELIERGGMYAQLWTLQQNGFIGV